MTAPNSASTPATCAQARHGVCCRWHAWQSCCLSKPSPAFPLHREMLTLLPKSCAGKLILPRALGTAQLWGATSRALCQPELLLHFNKGLKTVPPLPLPKNVVGGFFFFQLEQLPPTQRTHICTHTAGCTGQGPDTSGSICLKGTFATPIPATKVKTQIKMYFMSIKTQLVLTRMLFFTDSLQLRAWQHGNTPQSWETRWSNSLTFAQMGNYTGLARLQTSTLASNNLCLDCP